MKLPMSADAFAERFGPHPSRSTGTRLDSGAVPDRAVNTHCCFCGQQCGITLLVKDEEVVGFEPWMEFPFNQGKLCPKGVKRYLQGAHPDRLTTAFAADPEAPGGFRAVGYHEAIAQVAAGIDRVQKAYGADAFA